VEQTVHSFVTQSPGTYTVNWGVTVSVIDPGEFYQEISDGYIEARIVQAQVPRATVLTANSQAIEVQSLGDCWQTMTGLNFAVGTNGESSTTTQQVPKFPGSVGVRRIINQAGYETLSGTAIVGGTTCLALQVGYAVTEPQECPTQRLGYEYTPEFAGICIPGALGTFNELSQYESLSGIARRQLSKFAADCVEKHSSEMPSVHLKSAIVLVHRVE
jgi:hypothetical protein